MLWNRLFKKRKKYLKRETGDASEIKCDIHSHLIPGIDDGSKSIEESIDLIKGLHQQGYKKIVTTPHIMSDLYRNTPEIILSGLEKVRKVLQEKNIPVELEAASEYFLDYELNEKLKNNEKLLTFGNEKYLLFELSFLQEPDQLQEFIFNLQTKGYVPVLAHPERYPYWYGSTKLEELADQGVLLQLNLNSVNGYYGDDVQKIGFELLEKKIISFLGTDCHNEYHLDALQESYKYEIVQEYIASGLLLNDQLVN